MSHPPHCVRALQACTFQVVTPDETVDLLPTAPGNQSAPLGDLGFGTAVQALARQEIDGAFSERIDNRLAQLLDRFGFEWEPLSEVGHMRYVGHASFIFERARNHAAATTTAALSDLNLPLSVIEGVNVVDTSRIGSYLELTSTDARLYGDGPYEIASTAGPNYQLRHTGCIGKYSACHARLLAADKLPCALFEISDSYRREPATTLQLLARLRRFHLPEAHVHHRNISSAVELSSGLHQHILSTLSELDADLVLLISVTHDFAEANRDYIQQLTARAGCSALLKVSPPGVNCQDGVEVDVEYKVVDSNGACRELSTFQIDQQITNAFGVHCDDGSTPATIHTVITGGVERYIFCVFDRVVRLEAQGGRGHLPLWITPVVARVVPADAQSESVAAAVAAQLTAAQVRTELDDRGHGLATAIGDADSLLIPFLISVAADGRANNIRVREYNSGEFGNLTLAEVINRAGIVANPPQFARLSRLSREPWSDRKLAKEVAKKWK